MERAEEGGRQQEGQLMQLLALAILLIWWVLKEGT
jgi:hypothetical protein